MSTPIPSFQITLGAFLESHLEDKDGNDIEHRELTHSVFIVDECIKVAKQRGLLWAHLQTHSWEGEELDVPVLWRYKAWIKENEHQKELKRISIEERITRFIRDANVRIIAKALKEEIYWSHTDEQRTMIALQLLKQNNKAVLTAIGVEKLVTKESELT